MKIIEVRYLKYTDTCGYFDTGKPDLAGASGYEQININLYPHEMNLS